ncbi:hypothetical protein ACHAWF_017987 [Thalassiosira exigua]
MTMTMNVNAVASDLIAQVKSVLRYLHQNAWTIVFVLVGSYLLYDNAIDPLLRRRRARRSEESARDPERVAVLAPDMARVRAKQQEAAARRAVEAEEERKVREKAERERKRVKTPEEERWEKRGGEGTRLGDRAGESGGGARRRRR